MRSRRNRPMQFLASAALLAALAGMTPLQTGCATQSAPGAIWFEGSDVPLFEGMGPHTRKVTTNSERAQKYFDQGLTWAFAFNHDEAQRSFEEAARLDPDCATAYWGIALVNGPHINNPAMTEERSLVALEAIRKATQKAPWGVGTPQERALIQALQKRYADPRDGRIPLTFEERAGLDKAYADAMAHVYEQFKDDDDIATLYAESLMNLRPWDLWDGDKKPRPETPRILEAIEHALALNPRHPGAAHLYIHAVEASPFPEKADAASDTLRTLVPASGHLVHMPSHIDIRRGRWALAAEQNRQASRIDDRYREISPRQNFYRLYMAHNDHFLAYTCMMLGRKEEALSAARAMLSKVPHEWLLENAPIADGVAAIEIEAMVRFGMWDDVLEAPEPPAILPITRALWRFSRATALNAKGQTAEARSEQESFRNAVAAVPQDAMMAQNTGHEVLAIAELVLEGEILYREGNTDQAIDHLRRAAALEDKLRYMEPPDWLQPVRHALGAILLASGKPAEAERAYREDLEHWPENGWSLFGLAESLKAQNKPEEAEVRKRFEKAWQHADTKIGASCLCIQKS
jgi:tetratricopeptide (TPR) repeat protein